MKLIVGLGNPGKKHEHNRHNAGFLVLDELKSRISNFQSRRDKLGLFPISQRQARLISNETRDSNFQTNDKYQCEAFKVKDLILIKPTTQMNSSGIAVNSLASYYKIQNPNVWVIHDDLDIKLGQYKIQKGKGPKEHKGIKSVNKALGTRDYWRVRVGVDNRKSLLITNHQSPITPRPLGEDYVLQNFTDKELEILKSVIDKIVKELTDMFSLN